MFQWLSWLPIDLKLKLQTVITLYDELLCIYFKNFHSVLLLKQWFAIYCLCTFLPNFLQISWRYLLFLCVFYKCNTESCTSAHANENFAYYTPNIKSSVNCALSDILTFIPLLSADQALSLRVALIAASKTRTAGESLNWKWYRLVFPCNLKKHKVKVLFYLWWSNLLTYYYVTKNHSKFYKFESTMWFLISRRRKDLIN